MSPRASTHVHPGLPAGGGVWAVSRRVLAGSRKDVNEVEKALLSPGPHRPGGEGTQQREQKSEE